MTNDKHLVSRALWLLLGILCVAGMLPGVGLGAGGDFSNTDFTAAAPFT